MVLRGVRPALVASGLAALGAVMGGAVMVTWASIEPQQALAAVEWVPAISAEMVARVHTDLQQQGLTAVLLGAFTGVPYKIYAVQMPQTSISPIAFLLFSVPARVVRFVLVGLAVAGIDRRWFREWPTARKTRLLLAGWTLFYLVYLIRTPW